MLMRLRARGWHDWELPAVLIAMASNPTQSIWQAAQPGRTCSLTGPSTAWRTMAALFSPAQVVAMRHQVFARAEAMQTHASDTRLHKAVCCLAALQVNGLLALCDQNVCATQLPCSPNAMSMMRRLARMVATWTMDGSQVLLGARCSKAKHSSQAVAW